MLLADIVCSARRTVTRLARRGGPGQQAVAKPTNLLLWDGKPRFKVTETHLQWKHGPELEVQILDRAFCHQVVWRANSASLRGGHARGRTNTERIEATRRRARGALYEIEAECGG